MKNESGFTMVELVFSLLVGSVLMNMAVSASAPVLDHMSVKSASGSLASLHARARARAVERGRTVLFQLDPVGDSAWVTDGTERIETLRLGSQGGVDLVTASAFKLCISPRGYADTDCNSFTNAIALTANRGSATTALTILPLGQLVQW